MVTRIATRSLQAAFFNVGDLVVYGKFQNVLGKILGFIDDGKGNPLVQVESTKGVKKTFALFKIRHVAKPMTTRVALRFAVRQSLERLAADESVGTYERCTVNAPLSTRIDRRR